MGFIPNKEDTEDLNRIYQLDPGEQFLEYKIMDTAGAYVICISTKTKEGAIKISNSGYIQYPEEETIGKAGVIILRAPGS